MKTDMKSKNPSQAGPTDVAEANRETAFKTAFAIKVLGVGGAGSNAVNHLAREALPGVDFAVLNTDAAALAQSPVPSKLILGSKSSRGLGAGGDPERGRQSAEEDLETIRSLCQGSDIVFVVAGLGGGTGTGAGPVVARVAKECGALVLSIVMLPFDCEGQRRQRQAQFGLHVLKQASDGVISLPNQLVFKLIDEKTSLIEAFAITNELVAQGVRGIWRLLSKPGLINVDFADLCAVTQGKHSESVLMTVQARGEHRVREISDKILSHPLVEGGQTLSRASGLLVCIAGGPQLSMTEVERIMEQVHRHAEQAHIIMGTAIDEEFEDRLSVTIVASSHGKSVETAPAAPDLQPGEEGDLEPKELEEQLVDPSEPVKGSSRFVAPPPDLTPEKAREIYQQRGTAVGKKKGSNRMRQGQLPLEIVSKGRFEKSEPTLHRGEDLDVPTYIRRGVALN
jgi:cell division protein FtsZ